VISLDEDNLEVRLLTDIVRVLLVWMSVKSSSRSSLLVRHVRDWLSYSQQQHSMVSALNQHAPHGRTNYNTVIDIWICHPFTNDPGCQSHKQFRHQLKTFKFWE